MKTLQICIALLAMIWAFPAFSGYVTYENLYRACHARTGTPAEATKSGTCFGYISAVADAFQYRRRVHGVAACIPSTVSIRVIRDRMLGWMRKHPGDLIGNASTMVARGFSQLYPCGRVSFRSGDLSGFRDQKGGVVIKPRFHVAQEFSPENIAAVVDGEGWVYIDPFGDVLIRPHVVDNGPDDFSEGLARFVAGGKIGFMNKWAKIVVNASFAYAEPFSNGRALICADCRPVKDGEHTRMVGAKWGAIDSNGKTVLPAAYGRTRALELMRRK